MTKEFSGKYLRKNGVIDWKEIIEYVSKSTRAL